MLSGQYCKTDNYEIYSNSETRVGTWIDGNQYIEEL